MPPLDIWNLVYALGVIFTGYLSVVSILDKLKRNHAEDRVDQADRNTALELKVKELESKIAVQYGELKAQLENVEKALAEDKVNKMTFESRVLSLLDKTDVKMERLQDMLLRIFIERKNEQ